MKLGVFSPVLAGKSLSEALAYLKGLGVETIELGCGGYPGTAHIDAKKLIIDKTACAETKKLIDKSGIEISALSVHGNPVHPDKKIAASYNEDFEAACKLANAWGVDTVITFSGCPGDHDGSKYPNWVTCAWPPDYQEILKYQWNDVLVPYWKKAVAFAAKQNVKKIALEMHPGFCVYNPPTLMRLRHEAGDAIGANFDPSHLFWQGIDVTEAVFYLNKAIYHFHAKDTGFFDKNKSINGVLDSNSFADESKRAWIFRSVGYGSSEKVWKDMLSALNMVGYNGALSIEHEDSLMDGLEGLEKAVAFLKPIIIKKKKPGDIWWA